MKISGESYNWWNPWHWKKIRAYNKQCDQYRKEYDEFLKKNNVTSLDELEDKEYWEEREREERNG